MKVGLVESVEMFRWPSAKAHVTGLNETLLGENSWFSPQERSSYVEFVRTEDNAIRKATCTG